MRVLPDNESGLKKVSKKVGDGKTRKEKSWLGNIPKGLKSAGNFVSKTANIIDQFNRVDKSGNIVGDPIGALLPKRKKKKSPFFLNENKKNVDNIKKGDGITDSIGKLYTLFRKIDEDEMESLELEKFRRTEQYLEEERRHEEILKALKNVTIKETQDVTVTKPKKGAKEKKQQTTKPTAEPATKESSRNIGISAAKVGAGVGIAAAGVGTISDAIAQGESAKGSYNAANMGTKGGKIIPSKPVNLEEMTIAEVMQRQSIQWGSPNQDQKLFAVGKYQMIPDTLKDAVSALNINPTTTKYDRTTQERLFNEYLIGQRNKDVVRYVNSPVDDPVLLRKAIRQLSRTWASVADPDIPGGNTSHYGSGNKASISVETMADLLRKDRERNQKMTNPVEQINTTTPPVAEKIKENKEQKDAINKTVASTSNQINQGNVAIKQGDQKNYYLASSNDDQSSLQQMLRNG